MSELPKAYTPAEAEAKWYDYWYQNHLYDAEVNPAKKPFVILMPPPNVTGSLTIGHVLNHTLQDLYIRWKRMSGFEACWIPGTDHAGIATQTKVVSALRAEGIDFRDLGREKFLERVWEWKEEYGGLILRQLRALGISPDWRREVFTLDPSLSLAVQEVFVQLFDKGLIYRGKKIVNWSPSAQSTLSDEEVDHIEVQDTMYTLRYLLADGDGEIQIATARPETLYGDVAVAVHPSDERYKTLVGRDVIVPLLGARVKIIADDYPDPTFGTGALKITPAHDINDYEVGTRHNLPMPNTINADGSMNELAGPLSGMDRFEARKKAVEMLREQGLIAKEEAYTHSVGISQRGGEQIEPYLSDQWFISMKQLAEPALAAVRQGLIKLYPEHHSKTYEHWMTNIRDWAISRQLWWGHRIPVYYLEDGRFTAARSEDEARAKLGVDAGTPLRQDEDVLDTWFSSWLWPFSVHGWGSPEKKEDDLKYFYPTDLLITGPDIIFFWVARMIMAGTEFMRGEPKMDGTPRTELADLIPFRDVYFTSIVRDETGRKLSKSLGNSPDPLAVIDKYGADALRFTIVYLAPSGLDVRFSEESVEIGRNFANKLWNAGRFLMMKRGDIFGDAESQEYPGNLSELQPISNSDRWILSRFHSVLAEIDKALSSYRINEYSKRIYDFVWSDFCDWYLELMKTELARSESPEQSQQTILFAFALYDQVLRLLHPIMPFVTEEIWQNLAQRTSGKSVSILPFPTSAEDLILPAIEAEYELLQQVTEAIRRMRNEAGAAPSKGISVSINAPNEAAVEGLTRTSELLKKVARIETLELGTGIAKTALAATEVVRGNEIFVHLEGLVDFEKERAKTEKEITRLTGQVAALDGKLSNAKFVENAPADVVAREREKLATFKATIEKLQESVKPMA